MGISHNCLMCSRPPDGPGKVPLQDLRDHFSWHDREIITPVSGSECGQDRGEDPFVNDKIAKIIHGLIRGGRVFRIYHSRVAEKGGQGLSAAAGLLKIPESSHRDQAPVFCDTQKEQ
jgi:hypothetical protein